MADDESLAKKLDRELSRHSTARGSDSEGGEYGSIQEMWLSQGVVQEGRNEDWYERAADYYEENCDATLNGVLGGFAAITEVDLAGSRAFLEKLKTDRPKLVWSDGAGCECGAGIGRVTKGLLLPLGVSRCDLVESSPRLLASAPDYIGDPDAQLCRFYCEGLQNWTPPKDTYTIVWIQWVLCYLTDADIVSFLKRCGEGLKPHGVIVLKENSCQEDNFVLDYHDASVTRSLPYWLQLIEEAGLSVCLQEIQDDFPDELFSVPILALEVKRNETQTPE